MGNPFAHTKQPVSGGSFLPEDYISRKADGRANILCLFLFGVVMAGVASAFFVTNRQWESVKEEHEAINAAYEQESKKIEQLKSLEQQRESMIERAEITTALIEKNPRSVLAAEIVRSMPEGVTLLTADLKSKRVVVSSKLESGAGEVKSLSGSSAKSSKSGKSSKSSKSKSSGSEKSETPAAPRPQAPRFESMLILTGVAGANQDIADYLQALKTCEILESVELAYIKETVMSEMTLRKFQIDAKLRDTARSGSAKPSGVAGATGGDAASHSEQAAATGESPATASQATASQGDSSGATGEDASGLSAGATAAAQAEKED